MRSKQLFLFTLAIYFLSITGCLPAAVQQQTHAETEKKPTVCLNMIVKNESHVMKRCIDSVLPIIDSWVIVDTGSTDGTQQLIKDYMREKNIPGELYERPWVNFGANREEALQLAAGKSDYVLFMDADDTLNFEEDFRLPKLEADSYLIASNCGGMEYFIPRLLKMTRDWHWHGVLHEYVSADDAVTRETLSGVKYMYICDGARAKDPQKYQKDVKILSEALEKDPSSSRYMFYLAQSYASAGDQKKAIETYQKRVTMGGWPEEVFWSLLQIARLQEQSGVDAKEVEASYIKALKYRPTRPEPYYYLVNRARLNNEFKKGYKLGKLAIDSPPSNDTLFLEKWTYDGLQFEYSICAYYVEDYEESLKICNKLLSKKDLLPEYRQYTIANREFALEKLQQQKLANTIDALFKDATQASNMADLSQKDTTKPLQRG